MPSWLSPDELLQRLQQNPNSEWRERGAGILQAVLEEWKKGKPQAKVPPSKYDKRLMSRDITLTAGRNTNIDSIQTKATRVGPKYAGSMQDASGRHMCFQSGKRVPCQQFGGEGEGWQELRGQEDLYDALRRLVDELKAGKHDGWHELLGLLVHTPPEDLQALKREHNLSCPADAKQALTARLQQELQHIHHTSGGNDAQPAG